MKTLTFEPLISWPLWVALALAAAAMLGWYLVGARRQVRGPRRIAIALLMFAAVCLPLAILLNPIWQEQLAPPEGKPLVTILVDASTSMGTRDGDNKKDRYELAGDWATRMADKLGKQYDVRVKRFSLHAAHAELDDLRNRPADGEQTDLAQALREVAEADCPQGQAILLASDGIHNAAGGSSRVLESARRAGAMAAPAFVHTIGGATEACDLSVQLRAPQEVAFINETLPVTVLLDQHGLSGREVRLRLMQEGKQLAASQVALKPSGQTEVSFEVKEKKTGLYRYRIEADALHDEVTDANNRATLLVRVVDEPIRVLLLEGKPYWDTKFLIRTLAADASLDLVSLVRMAEGRLLEQTLRPDREQAAEKAPEKEVKPAEGETKPADETRPRPRVEGWKIRRDAGEILGDPKSLAAYQVIVLGRDSDIFLDDTVVANLRKWVARDGGSLVCFRGAPAPQIAQGLNPLLPVRWTPARESRFHMQLTDRGKQLRWFTGGDDAQVSSVLADLPTLATGTQPGRLKPLAVVLAEAFESGGSSQPVIIYQPFGSGRTVVVEGAGMWRWALLPPHDQGEDQVYGTLWHNLTRWLVSHTGLLPTQAAMLRTDKVRFSADEPATATLLVREELAGNRPRNVVLKGPQGKAEQEFTPIATGDEPGAFRVVFGVLPEGDYHASLSPTAWQGVSIAGETSFEVRRSHEEQLNLKARPDVMARIAKESGGAVVDGQSPDELQRQFETHLARVRPERIQRTPAWDRWWVLVGVCAIWAASWGVRRSSGLV